MKKLFFMVLAAACCTSASAEGFKTAGDGTVYNFEKLSQMEDSGVYKWGDEDDGEVFYLLFANDTIAAGDKFVMDDGVTIQFDDDVVFVIEGEADFKLSTGSTFESAYDDGADYVTPIGIKVGNEQSQTVVENCQFYTVGLRCTSTKGMKLNHCAFYSNNGAIGQGALTIGVDGAPFALTNCTFEDNGKAAIAGAANYRNPLLIEDCTFTANGSANGNTPQLNLTVADSVVIRNCVITGRPEHTMVGGIVVANLMGYSGDYTTLIEGNTIEDNRFGIATYLEQKAYIRHNVLKNNCHETTPMNGGSGINVYDPYYKQYTYISGNHIEGSLWGITLVGGREANLGRVNVPIDDPDYNPGQNTFVDNGNDGVLYDLYNNSTNTVYAQGNTWNVSQQTEAQIEDVVFHKADNASLGQVIFMPAAGTQGIEAIEAADAEAGTIYDLQGRKLQPSVNKKGIVIVNGKKVVL